MGRNIATSFPNERKRSWERSCSVEQRFSFVKNSVSWYHTMCSLKHYGKNPTIKDKYRGGFLPVGPVIKCCIKFLYKKRYFKKIFSMWLAKKTCYVSHGARSDHKRELGHTNAQLNYVFRPLLRAFRLTDVLLNRVLNLDNFFGSNDIP